MKAIVQNIASLIAAGFIILGTTSAQSEQFLASNDEATSVARTSAGTALILKTSFLNDVMEVSGTRDASYYQTIQAAGAMGFMLKTYFLTGELKMIGHTKESGCFLPDGEFVFYYQNGAVESRGQYRNGVKAGIWERYASDGTSKAERVYTGIPVELYFETPAYKVEEYFTPFKF